MISTVQLGIKQPACQADNERADGVKASGEQEAHKVTRVPVTNACADPGTVMVVHLDADAARTTVEGPGRPQKFACAAIAHLVMLIAGARDQRLALFVELRLLVLELLNVVELGDMIVGLDALLLHGDFELVPRLIQRIVILLVLDGQLDLITQLVVERQTWQDAGLRVRTLAQVVETQE